MKERCGGPSPGFHRSFQRLQAALMGPAPPAEVAVMTEGCCSNVFVIEPTCSRTSSGGILARSATPTSDRARGRNITACWRRW